MKTLKEILMEAADLIDERGRAVDMFYSTKQDCYCMVGAIGYAAEIYNPGFPDYAFWENPIIEEACEAIVKLNNLLPKPSVARSVNYLFEFNDNNFAADIADLLRKTAEAL